MGCYSWLRASRSHKLANVLAGKKIKLLIPKEFGGGSLIGTYDGYGRLTAKDKSYSVEQMMYNWNGGFLRNKEWIQVFNEMFVYFAYKRERDVLLRKNGDIFQINYRDQRIREIEKHYDSHFKFYKNFISEYISKIVNKPDEEDSEENQDFISKYLTDNYLLPFPLKLVSIYYKGTYESCNGCSMEDPYQGLNEITWEEVDRFYSERGEFTERDNLDKGELK